MCRRQWHVHPIDQANVDERFFLMLLQSGETYYLNRALNVRGSVYVYGLPSGSSADGAPIITAAEGVYTRIVEIDAPGEKVSFTNTRITGGHIRSPDGGGIGGAGFGSKKGLTRYWIEWMWWATFPSGKVVAESSMMAS